MEPPLTQAAARGDFKDQPAQRAFKITFGTPCDLGCERGNQNQDVLLRRRSRATPARDSKRSGRRDYRRDLKALRIALRPLSMRPRMSEKAARSWRAEPSSTGAAGAGYPRKGAQGQALAEVCIAWLPPNQCPRVVSSTVKDPGR